MAMIISRKDKNLRGTVHLPSSKSMSNRALVMQALCNGNLNIDNLSEADDTQILKNILVSISENQESKITYDVGASGTSMRFLTAYLATLQGTRILTGSQRMKERPIGILVDALIKLGAKISYLENEGFPPLKIIGSELQGGTVEIDANVSSQYTSALLMIAPTLKEGLEIGFTGDVISKPYIEMTLKMMEYFGIKTITEAHSITVLPGEYQSNDFEIEADWSAASYWFEMAALANEADLTLNGLKQTSMQGDAVVAEIFKQFGLTTTSDDNGIRVVKSEASKKQQLFLNYNFSDYPDLTPALAVTCAGLQVMAHFTGMQTLRIKETDRLLALQNELTKLGVETDIIGDDELIIKRSSELKARNLKFETYNDHRMAMAFAPLALILGKIEIDNPEVVSKSYPGFWNELESVGFILKF